MTHRGILRASIATAVLIQVAWLLAAGVATHWGQGAILQMPALEPPPRYAMWFAQSAGLFWHVGSDHQVGSVGTIISGAAINGVLWTAVVFLILHLLALPLRLGAERGSQLGFRLRLRPLHEIPWRRLAPLLLLVAGSMLFAGTHHRRAWIAGAERAAEATIAAMQAGRPLPYHGVLGHREEYGECPAADFRGDAELRLVDRRWMGSSFLDRFVPPEAWIGEARFANGSRYRFHVMRADGSWRVSHTRAGALIGCHDE